MLARVKFQVTNTVQQKNEAYLKSKIYLNLGKGHDIFAFFTTDL